MSLGLEDPELGMGSIDATSPPSGSTQNPDGSYTDPNGNTWLCSGGVCLQIIGSSGVSAPAPAISISGVPPGGAPNGFVQLVKLPPTPGQTCQFGGAGSPSTALGVDIPHDSADAGKDLDIVNIFALYEPATVVENPAALGGISLGGGEDVVGYVYVTASGLYFFQSNGADPSMFTSLLNAIPGAAAANAAANGGYSPPLTSSQANALFKQYPVTGANKGSQPCFTSALPKSQWT
jgi:hypothetical protein